MDIEIILNIIFWYKVAAAVISLVLFSVIVWTFYILNKLLKEIWEKEGLMTLEGLAMGEKSIGQKRWGNILVKLKSENEADWRVAILEADSVLEEIVETMGIEGESLGEKMKKIEKSDFLSLDNAWEAHKGRNKIAHDSMNVPISRREAERILRHYEKVFQEFKYI